MKALQDFLRPEFINRVDEIVYFHQLTEDNFKAIAGLMLRELKDSPGRAAHLPHLGGQPAGLSGQEVLLRRLPAPGTCAALIQKELEDAIAERIIGSWQHPVSRINVSSDGESLILTTV